MTYCEQMCNNLLTVMQNSKYAKPIGRACRRPGAKVRAVHSPLPHVLLMSLQCHRFLSALEHKAKAVMGKVCKKAQNIEEHNRVGHAKGQQMLLRCCSRLLHFSHHWYYLLAFILFHAYVSLRQVDSEYGCCLAVIHGSDRSVHLLQNCVCAL